MARSPMLDDRWSAIWTVFHAVVEQPAEKRALVLAESCGDDAELRREVDELLAVHDEGVPILDESIFDLAPTLPSSGDADSGPPLRPGALLAGRFEIVDRIAAGGMGEVYRAYDRELGREVALKTVVAGRRGSASSLARFRREIHLAQQVTHRNVCRVFDLVRDGNLLFLTMELLEGETLGERLEHEGRLTLAEIRAMLDQIVAALEAAHVVGVVHRDLKPSNVILVEDSNGVRVVVTDFGLATSGSLGAVDDPQITRTGQIMGTPAYMAPEQLEGEEASPATDVYAIGLLLYEMVTGERPFSGPTTFSVASRRLAAPPSSPREHVPELDERWEQVILRCLERRPEDRFQHPREIIAALKDESIPLEPPVRVRPARRMAFALAALVATVVVAIGLAWWSGIVSKGTADEENAAVGRHLGFEERDAVLVAQFDNRTGEPSLDGVLGVALARELSSSTFLNVVSHGRIADSLRLMRLPPDATIDVETARQVALRDGGIPAVIGGSAEKLGRDFVVTANLFAPGDDEIITSWSEEAGDDVSGIPAALRSIASRAREYLGENPAKIELYDEGLKKVTTPSLRALRLYDEADAAIPVGRSDVAEELIREAIREDPEFGSAYIILAYTLHNQNRPPEEYLPPAERAMELADGLPDRERYFIRASYYSFTGDEKKMLANYAALLRLHPDHFWANNNLGNFLPPEDAVPYKVQSARLRPQNLFMNFRAAHTLATVANRPGEAQPFIDRVIELSETETPNPRHASFPAWGRLWKAHRQWMAGEVELSRAELDRWADQIGRFGGQEEYWMRQFLIRGYRNLGMADRAMELAPPNTFRTTRQYLRGVDSYFVGDSQGVLNHFTASNWADQTHSDVWRDPLRVAGLARSGWIEEAHATYASFLARPSAAFRARRAVSVEARMEGELMLAGKRFGEAAEHLEKRSFGGAAWVPNLFPEYYGSSYFLMAQALSIAYRQLGRDEDAVAILEQAVAERARSYPNGTELWMDTQLRLAELYRELGQTAKAERLEEELRDLMRLADPDFWLVRRLNEIHPDS